MKTKELYKFLSEQQAYYGNAECPESMQVRIGYIKAIAEMALLILSEIEDIDSEVVFKVEQS